MSPSRSSLAALMAAAALASSPLQAQEAAIPLSEPSDQILRVEPAFGLYELVYSASEDALFVASAGTRDASAPARVLRLDPVTLETRAEILLPGKGFGLALDEAGGRLFVGDTTDASITVIDIRSNTVSGEIQLAEKVTTPEGKEEYPHHFRELVFDAAHNRLYAPGLGFTNSALYVIDTAELKVASVTEGFGAAATGITLDADRGRLYMSNLEGQVYVFETSGPDLLRKFDAEGDQLLNLAVDAGRNRLIATDQGNEFITGMREDLIPGYQLKGPGNEVLILDAESGETLIHIGGLSGPVAPFFDPDGNRIFVSSREDGTVRVYDGESYAPLQTIALPDHPNSFTYDAGRKALFVTVKNGEGKRGAESVVRLQLD